MASRWLKWPRNTRSDAGVKPALTQVTGIFLDLDSRQSIAESAVAATMSVSPDVHIEQDWASVRETCYAASAAYLRIADPTSSWDTIDGIPAANAPNLQQTQQLLESARSALDSFYDRHRSLLDSAVNQAASISRNADSVLAGAQQARQLLARADARLVEYPSVRQARERLEASSARLQDAQVLGDVAASVAAAQRLQDATAEVTNAILSAPGRDEQARRTISSVRTRIEAVRTRAAETPALISALLRDFNAKSSADLLYNEKLSHTYAEEADALLKQAVIARVERRPEDSLEHAAQARAQIAEAEKRVDEVKDRLTFLTDLRADPAKRAQDARFRLRDVQRLVVDRGEISQWGSVLDAQSERIDRIVASLDAPHPDYLAYDRALGDVSAFIANVVSRIRQGTNR